MAFRNEDENRMRGDVRSKDYIPDTAVVIVNGMIVIVAMLLLSFVLL